MSERVSARFEDRVAVVTGSTRGIGEGVARRLAAEEAAVIVTGRDADGGAAVAESLRDAGGDAVFHRTDVRDPDAIEALFEATVDRYGGVDVLVNNAAVQTEVAAMETTLSEWSRVVDTNLRGYWLCAKAASERMTTGAIVNVSSNHSSQTMPSHFPYNVTKSAIDGLTRALCLDFGPRVRVNSVNPGWVAVERTTGEMSDTERARLELRHPVGRIGTPEDVAAAVAYLASDEAGFVNGACLTVDGGRGAILQDDALPGYGPSGGSNT